MVSKIKVRWKIHYPSFKFKSIKIWRSVERNFDELESDQPITQCNHNDQQSTWIDKYNEACTIAAISKLKSLDIENRLAYSGIFNDDDSTYKHLRFDLPCVIEMNVKLLKRCINDQKLYIPTIHSTFDELVLNNILMNTYLQYSALTELIQ
ncbi:unnamed protein product [Cunninghamella blakesleeana]